MFRGVNKLNLDAKGRLAVPTRYREQLRVSCGSQLVITVESNSINTPIVGLVTDAHALALLLGNHGKRVVDLLQNQGQGLLGVVGALHGEEVPVVERRGLDPNLDPGLSIDQVVAMHSVTRET